MDIFFAHKVLCGRDVNMLEHLSFPATGFVYCKLPEIEGK